MLLVFRKIRFYRQGTLNRYIKILTAITFMIGSIISIIVTLFTSTVKLAIGNIKITGTVFGVVVVLYFLTRSGVL